jgi:hypothetical protein
VYGNFALTARAGALLLAVLLAFTWHTWLPIAVSVVALGFAYRADKRAGRAETRAKSADDRDVTRFQRETREAKAASQAVLVIEARGANRGNEFDDFAFRIRNDGPVRADDIEVWLVDSDESEVTHRRPDTSSLFMAKPLSPKAIPAPESNSLRVVAPATGASSARGSRRCRCRVGGACRRGCS